MIVRGELAAWLGSRVDQQRAARAAEGVRVRWRDLTLWSGLRAAIAAAAGDLDKLSRAAAWALQQDEAIAALVEELISEARGDPFFRPPLRTVRGDLHSGLLLFQSDEIVISLGVIRLEPLAAKKAMPLERSSIVFNGERTLLRLLRSGSALFSFWEAPPAGTDFSAASAGTCRLVGRRRVRDGEMLDVDGRRQSFVIENAQADIVLLQATVHRSDAPVSVEYDSRDGTFVGASSAVESDSRLEMMATLLRLLDAREAISLLSEALAGSSFHTRWHIMRELLAWDAEAALPILHTMSATDPHPEVREAACRTLGLFFAEDLQPCPA